MNVNAKSLCALAAALALGLAACGDDNDDEAGGGTTATETEEQEQAAPEGKAAQTVALTESEYKIDPSNAVVDKAGVVEFKVENAGQVTHALEIEGGDLEEKTDDIAPGESASLKVDLKPGTYDMYCPIGNHKEQGMTGELTVAGGGGASTDESEDDSGGTSSSDESEDDSGY